MDRSAVTAALDRTDSTVRTVGAIVVLGLLARIVFLGNRVAHYDEGRVAYWAYDYLQTGEISYRYIVHGPFAQYVNAALFGLFGTTDFIMRLFVALVGAALPLVALLFRDRLRDAETVAMAALLAFNPVLLYYSRFYRSTLLVAAFMTAAFGFALRASDRNRPALLYPAFALAGLGFASKENAVVYVLCWLGAGALLLDFSLMNPADARTGTEAIARRLRPLERALSGPDRSTDAVLWSGITAVSALLFVYTAVSGWALTAAVALLVGFIAGVMLLDELFPDRAVFPWGEAVLGGAGLFLAISLFFYAPRAPGPAVGLWDAVFDPTLVPQLLDSTWADIERGLNYWFGGSTEPGCGKDNLIAGYLCYLEHSLGVLADYAAVTTTFAVVGFLVARYATDRPRPLVMFAGYWGFVSVFGYPLATDIRAGWVMVNALVPLTLPAGVGLGMVGRWGRRTLLDEDRVGMALTAMVFLLVAGLIVGPAVSAVYLNPTADDNAMVQYAQPQQEMRTTLSDIAAIAPAHEGTDVLFYGSELVAEPGSGGEPRPECLRLLQGLPMHWYAAADGWETACAYNSTALDQRLAEDDPAVVIAHAKRERELANELDGYEKRFHYLRTMGREIVVFVDEDELAAAEGSR
ncbi:MAG: flippase activity-associated protein Agl23 [Halolamina sp.]